MWKTVPEANPHPAGCRSTTPDLAACLRNNETVIPQQCSNSACGCRYNICNGKKLLRIMCEGQHQLTNWRSHLVWGHQRHIDTGAVWSTLNEPWSASMDCTVCLEQCGRTVVQTKQANSPKWSNKRVRVPECKDLKVPPFLSPC